MLSLYVVVSISFVGIGLLYRESIKSGMILSFIGKSIEKKDRINDEIITNAQIISDELYDKLLDNGVVSSKALKASKDLFNNNTANLIQYTALEKVIGACYVCNNVWVTTLLSLLFITNFKGIIILNGLVFILNELYLKLK